MKRKLLLFVLIILSNVSYAEGYQQELERLNNYLADYDDGYYGYFEVKDKYVILHFKEGKYCKFLMQDMADPIIDSKYGQLHFDCKNEKYCITTDWNSDGIESGILFTDIYGDEINYLNELLQSFKEAYLKYK